MLREDLTLIRSKALLAERMKTQINCCANSVRIVNYRYNVQQIFCV